MESRADVETRALSEDEFRALFDAHYVYACRALMRLGVSRADVFDVAQELFLLVHRDLASFDRGRSVRAWLYGFALRLAANYRRLARHKDRTLSHDAEAADGAEGHDARDLVLRALSTLPEEQREVLVLFDLEGFDAKEIARLTNVGVNTIYSRLRLAREAFREAVTHLQGASEVER